MCCAVSDTDDAKRPHQVLVDAEELLTLDPARAELWVSGLLADLLPAEIESLLDELADEPNGVARLLAATISVVADVPVSESAQRICSPAELFEPEWAGRLGTARPVDAVAVEIDGVRSSFIVRFAHSASDRHLMLADLLESDDGEGVISDLFFAPDGLFEEEFDDPAIELVPVDLDGLGPTLFTALERADLATPSIALNRLVARRRLETLGAGQSAVMPADDGSAEALETDLQVEPVVDDHHEADAAAVELLEVALGKQLASNGPSDAQIEAVADRLRTAEQAGRTTDVAVVQAAAGLDGEEPATEYVLRFVSAYGRSANLDQFGPEEREAILHLEWADWLGAIIGLVRAGAGTVVTPSAMVKAINRCPEITTTIPKADATYVAWSFELTLHAWSLAGVLDDEDRLTAFGAELLPRAFRDLWRP